MRSLLPLRLACVLGFLKAASNMAVIYSPTIWQVSNAYPAYFVAASTLSVVALGGLWALRRWGLWLYIAYALFAQAVPWMLHRWDSSILVLPAATLAVAAFYYRRLQ
ncbi:MAG TPA: hypothetical protein VFR02_06955 [bacterium]|nr:hypothetical protein [bacterium]